MARPNKVWFRKDVCWWMVTIGGRKIRLAKGRSAKKDAERKLHELLAVRPLRPEADDARTADVIEAFLADVQRRLSAETYRGYLFYCQKAAEAFGDVLVRDLKPYHVTRWIDGRQWNATTEYNARRAVFRVFSWAAEERLIAANPLRGMRRPQPRSRQRCLTDDEFRSVLGAARGPFKMFVWALRQTGARPSELRRLTWNEVAANRLVLHDHKTAAKVRKPRTIHLTPAMQHLLSKLRARATTNHVFVNNRGVAWTTNAVRLQMQRIRQRVGLPKDVCAYLVRHTFGTKAILNGVDVATVAELMGHSSLEMVSKVYLHLADESKHLHDAVCRATAKT